MQFLVGANKDKADRSEDKADRSGVTPFLIASKEGNLEILRLLVEKGADKYTPHVHRCQQPIHLLNKLFQELDDKKQAPPRSD